jgi:predicted transglutaminase-like cysteine proteinase
MFIWFGWLSYREVKMASKTLAVIAIALVVVVAVFILDTSSLLDPILDRLPGREPEAAPKAVLWVNGYLNEAVSPADSNAIAYSVSNLGNATAENVTLAVVVDGETRATKQISSLSVSDTATYSLEVPDAGGLCVVSVQASCADSADAYSFSFGENVPRTFSDDGELVKLFVTPREASVVALKEEVLKKSLLNVKDWIALRDWVGNNVEYRHDEDVHGVPEYWQFSKETLSLRTGDCEDFAILLCSLLRSAGYSADDVYVVIGKNADGYHAWVRINVDLVGWYNLEPQQNGFGTFLGDSLTLLDYTALYQFNDQQFHQLS